MKFKVIGIGEVLWDLLPDGRQLGGAPANYSYHTRALGADGQPISRVGDDEDGREIIARLEQLGVPTDCIQVDAKTPTGTVSVELREGQPKYTIDENVAWDRLAVDANARRVVADADAVCFGTLAQRNEISRGAIRELLGLMRADCLRILDVNLRQSFYSREMVETSLKLANVLKVNDGELPEIAAMLGLRGDANDQMKALSDRFALGTIALTRGDRGSLLFSDGRFSDFPGVKTIVADTIGAGDSFTAAMTIGLLSGWSLDVVNERANFVAAFVASCAGGTPELPNELCAEFSGHSK